MGHKVSMSSCTCSCNEKPEAWTCGSRTIWAGCTGFLVVLGIVLIVVAIVSGGCSCASECAIGQPKDHCNSYFGGCEKGDYDSNKCVAVFFARGDAQIACGDASCKMGGLDANLMWALIIIGIICFVISCAFCCGICPCLCFLNTNMPAVSSMAPCRSGPRSRSRSSSRSVECGPLPATLSSRCPLSCTLSTCALS